MRPNDVICDGCQLPILAIDVTEVRITGPDGGVEELDFHAQSQDDCMGRWLLNRRLASPGIYMRLADG